MSKFKKGDKVKYTGKNKPPLAKGLVGMVTDAGGDLVEVQFAGLGTYPISKGDLEKV